MVESAFFVGIGPEVGMQRRSVDVSSRSRSAPNELGYRFSAWHSGKSSSCVESTVRDAMLWDYSCVRLGDCMSEPIGQELPKSNHEASLLSTEVLLGWVCDSHHFTTPLQA